MKKEKKKKGTCRRGLRNRAREKRGEGKKKLVVGVGEREEKEII